MSQNRDAPRADDDFDCLFAGNPLLVDIGGSVCAEQLCKSVVNRCDNAAINKSLGNVRPAWFFGSAHLAYIIEG